MELEGTEIHLQPAFFATFWDYCTHRSPDVRQHGTNKKAIRIPLLIALGSLLQLGFSKIGCNSRGLNNELQWICIEDMIQVEHRKCKEFMGLPPDRYPVSCFSTAETSTKILLVSVGSACLTTGRPCPRI
jgi:hypothetical protein